MPRTQKMFTSFTTGEISPKLSSRIDFAKYINGCETLENYTILPQGGVTRRPGLRFVKEVKDSSKAVRVETFLFSVTDAYTLEIGENYIRFYKNQARLESGGSPVEVTTTYAEADLFDLHFAQSADILYIAHKDYAPRKLSRVSDTSWTFSTITFNPGPSVEVNTDLGEEVTLSAITGDGVTVTPDSTEALFLAADIGRNIVSGAGRGIIISINTGASPDTVDMDVQDDFADTTLEINTWELTGSPDATNTPSATGPVGKIITMTLAVNGWRAADVGKFVKINNGLVKITSFTSVTVVKGEVLHSLDSTTAATGGTWTLEVESWTSARGFPAAIGFFEQRLFYARTDTQPQTIWGSVIDDYENFATGTNDTDSLDFPLTGQNPIRWLSPKSRLSVGTFGGEFIIGSTNDAALSPTNVKIDDQTTHGSSGLQPLRVGEVTLFLQRSKRKLREFVFVFEDDSFQAPDLTKLAEHITLGGINDMAYQQELESVIPCVRNDGQLPSLTYQRADNIVGWNRSTTGASGLFESVTSIPISDKDQTWVVVNRTINGQTKRFIEYFDEDAWSSATAEFDQWNMLNTDSAVIYDGVSITTMIGLGHLEGEEVAVIANGASHPNKTVSGGQITLDRAATEVEVGLAYTSTLKTVRPEVGLATGTSQGRFKGWSEIIVRLLDSLGGTANGDRIETRTPQDNMDEEPPLYSDDYVVQALGYDRKGQITITQDQAFPQTILSITGTMDISEN